MSDTEQLEAQARKDYAAGDKNLDVYGRSEPYRRGWQFARREAESDARNDTTELPSRREAEAAPTTEPEKAPEPPAIVDQGQMNLFNLEC